LLFFHFFTILEKLALLGSHHVAGRKIQPQLNETGVLHNSLLTVSVSGQQH